LGIKFTLLRYHNNIIKPSTQCIIIVGAAGHMDILPTYIGIDLNLGQLAL